MNKNIIRLFTVILSVTMFLVISNHSMVLADFQNSMPLSDIGIESYQYLKTGQCSIEDIGSGNVSISGYTTAYESVDTIGIKFYLERYTGGKWSDYKTWPTIEEYNTSEVWGKVNSVSVPKGYQYRLRAVHSVKKGNVTETGQSYFYYNN